MAIVIDFTDGRKSIEWYQGEVLDASDELPEPHKMGRLVACVSADEKELGLVLREFHNIPWHTGVMNYWYGETAQMIAARVFQLNEKNAKRASR